MKQTRLGKRVAAWLLCLAMVMTAINLPAFTTEAKAEEISYVTVTSWAELQAGIEAEGTDARYFKLGSDITASETDTCINVGRACKPEEDWTEYLTNLKNITIDLNGHTLDRGLADSEPEEGGSHFVVWDNGSLSLVDNSGTKAGKITGANNTLDYSNAMFAGAINNGGTLLLRDITITGNKTTGYGGGIFSFGVGSVKNILSGKVIITGNLASEENGRSYIASDIHFQYNFTKVMNFDNLATTGEDKSHIGIRLYNPPENSPYRLCEYSDSLAQVGDCIEIENDIDGTEFFVKNIGGYLEITSCAHEYEYDDNLYDECKLCGLRVPHSYLSEKCIYCGLGEHCIANGYHNFKTDNWLNEDSEKNAHYRYCIDCEKNYYEDHKFEFQDDTNHKCSDCGCIQEHSYTVLDEESGTKLCEDCGYSNFMFDESHKSIVIAGITYTKVEDGVTVKASDNSLTGDLVIPYEIATASGVLKVISVEENSFSSCTGLSSVGIPNGVTYSKTDFPNGVAINVYETDTANFSVELDNGKLGVKAANKDIAGEINIPSYVLYEGKVLPVEYVVKDGFRLCNKVTKIVLPDTVTLIKSTAFWDCTELGSINISKSVSQVNSCVFRGCNSLSNIVVDSDNPIFTMQGEYFIDKTSNTLVTATNNAINEGKLVIPYGVEIIDDGAFDNRKGFTEVEIPTTVRIIRYCAFEYTDLVKVDIPFGVEEIGGHAFSHCDSLVSISLPSSLKRVGYGRRIIEGNSSDTGTIFHHCDKFTGMINIPCSINEVQDGDGIGLGYKKYIVVPDSYVDNYYKQKGWTGYARTGTHDYTDQPWLVDAEGKHYQVCRGCGVESEHADHTFVNDAENNNHKCLVCGETGNHDFSESEYQNDGEGKHYRICTLCTTESEHEACSGGTATCQKKAVCSLCKTEYGELAAHTWDAGEITTAATCKDKGVKTFKCTVTGCTATKTEDVEIDSSNHVNTEILNAKDATCTEKGYTGDTHCKDCDTTVVGTDIAATGHDMTRVVSTKVAATCEVDGKEAVMGCKNCDHEEGGAVIQAKGHTWDAGTVTTPATCKDKGVKTFKCTVDECTGTKTEDIAINASNHVNTEVVGKKDATCTEKGYTGDTHCKDCEKTISEGTEIAAIGHDMTKIVSERVAATCEKDGKEAVMGCKNCDHEEGGAVIPAKGHTWDAGTVTTPATCKTEGVKTFKCTVDGCNKTKTEAVAVDANNHINTEVINAKEATCTEKGYTGDTHCKDCDTTIAGTEIAATGHDMTKIVSERVAATCEKDGKEAVMGCKNCDYTEGGAVIKATDHKWDSGKVTKEATVSEEGVKTFTCTNPGCKETKTEAIAKLPEPKKNAVIEDKTGNDYKVADPAKKEVTYKAPANKKAKTVTIPANVTIDGVTYKVTKIDDNAFKGNKTVTTVKVPNTVTTIGKDAFNGCSKLKTISIPKNVTEIGKNAFKGCAALTKITLPSKCTKIGANAFNGCKKMKTITIKSTKLTSKSIASGAFKGLSKNVTIKVPKKQLKAYKSLLKKKGFKGKVK